MWRVVCLKTCVSFFRGHGKFLIQNRCHRLVKQRTMKGRKGRERSQKCECHFVIHINVVFWYADMMPLNRMAQCVMLRIPAGPEIVGVPSVPPDRCRDSTLNRVKTSPFHIISNSFFSIIISCYMISPCY